MYPITRPMLLIQPVSLLLRNRRRAGRPMPVVWMITSPSFAHTKWGVFGGSE